MRVAEGTANRQAWIVAAALFLTLLLGGGGSPSPAPEMALQIATLVLFAAWFWLLRVRLSAALHPAARAIAIILLAVPAVQLIPLPPSVWQSFPGREIEAEALALVGQADTWRPISLYPARTLSALLAMGSAAALLVMTSATPVRLRGLLLAVLAGCGLLTVLVGAAQVSSAPSSPLFPYGAGTAALHGFQANRNSTADVLLVAMIAFFFLIARSAARGGALQSRRAVLMSAGLVAAVMGLAAALTQSRTGVALIPVALVAGCMILKPWLPLTPRTFVFLGTAAALVAVLASQSGPLQRVADRFDARSDARIDIWRDSLFVARQTAPVGVGMGGFVPAFIAGERLEAVGQSVPNRAHNDYLELVIEAGLLGVLACGACALLTGRVALAALRNRSEPELRALTIAALSMLAIIALHSLVDYPLRSMALAGVAAVCAGMIFPPAASSLQITTTRRDSSVP